MQSNQEKQLISADDYIILVDNRNDKRLLKIAGHKNFKWRKTPVKIELLTQFEYYQLLQVGNCSLSPVQHQNPDELSQQENQDGEIANNNKQIFTLEQAQKLNTQDIQKLKKQVKPQEIINQLVQNNEQFQKRTAYSKAKYLKKKQRKYIFKFHVEPICLQNLHNYYYSMNQRRYIGEIRWDMLALMLLHGGPYRKVMIAEKNKGLLTGAVLIKGASQVTVMAFSQKNLKALPILSELNLSQQIKDKVKFGTWQDCQKQQNLQKNKNHFTNILVLGNYDFASIVLLIQKTNFLQSNGIICFYCLSSEPLLQAMEEMKKYKHYLNVRLYDSWCRQYQVLKNRTHPMMYMDSCSGYLLTAIRGQKIQIVS